MPSGAPIGTWTSADTVFTSDFFPWSNPLTIEVDAGSGTVEIQHQADGGSWVAFEVLSADTVKKIDTKNMPDLTFHATGDAKYRITWKG